LQTLLSAGDQIVVPGLQVYKRETINWIELEIRMYFQKYVVIQDDALYRNNKTMGHKKDL